MADNDAPTTEDPTEGLPELKTYQAESEDDQVEALRLLADGVAQMRQTANTALIFHPLNLAVVVATLAVAARYVFQARGGDAIAAGSTCTGATMLWFVLCRWMTQPYLDEAEKINFTWLGDAEIWVTKFGDEIVGVVIIDWVAGESRQKKKKPQKGEIKGWTVRLKYRNKGVGAALLETAVAESWKKGAETVEFSVGHASACSPIFCRYLHSS